MSGESELENIKIKIEMEKIKISREEKIKKYVSDNSPKVFILTPCYNGSCHVNYIHSLISTIQLFQYFKIELQVEFCKNDSLICRARNNLVAKAMSDPKMTHVVFIDADIQWNPTDLITMLVAEKHIIGGAYPIKNYNWSSIIPDTKDSNKIQTLIDKKNNSVLKKVMTNEEIIRSRLVNYNINFLENENKIIENLIQVKHLATGFMMIKRGVFVKMCEAFPSTKYTDDVHFLSDSENKWAFALFDCSVEDGHYLSEDWLFCSRWSKMGGILWLDVTANLNHVGSETFMGSFMSTIV